MSYIQNGTGGGGGSGTVSANNGSAGAIANYAAAGGSTTVGPDANLTDASNTLTYTAAGGILASGAGGLNAGANGGSAGVVSLKGSTSGAATITAPAVAGTVTNPIAISNVIQLPNGAITAGLGAIQFANAGQFYSNAANACTWAFTGVNGLTLNGSSLKLAANSAGVNFTNTNSDSTATSDTGIGRAGAGILAIGKGTGASDGLVQSAMTVFVTSNFTTSGVGTALETITGLSITVPAVAINWKWHAHLSYSQAVANAAVAFGIQAATNAPTNIFANGLQQITVGPPATFTTGTLATLSTTTATTIVSGTPTATATNYICELSGTCELGASANTIRLSVSTGTAADLVTVLRGSYFSFCP